MISLAKIGQRIGRRHGKTFWVIKTFRMKSIPSLAKMVCVEMESNSAKDSKEKIRISRVQINDMLIT